ncbi:MAG: DNA polymerase III subunit delta [Herpetosiphon sp.]
MKSQRPGKDRDGVRQYLPSLPSTTDLVFVEGEEWDKRSAIFSFLKQRGEVRHFPPLEGAQLTQWIRRQAEEWGARLAPSAVPLLVEFAGNDSRGLLNEIAKLATFAGPGGTVTAEMVRLLVADGSETSVFGFVDALAGRKLAAALGALRDLLDGGEPPHRLLFMIGRQVRLLLLVKSWEHARLRPDDLASKLGQKPFVVRKAVDQARLFKPGMLNVLHDRLCDFDHWSKTGRIEADAALELLVAEMCM